MLAQAFHGGPMVEVYTAQGSKPSPLCKIMGGVKKEFEKSVKGYVMAVEGGRDARLQFPPNDRESLGLLQHYLVLQVYIPVGKGFSIELAVSDLNKTRRRINMSTNNKDVYATPLHVRLPLDIIRRGEWLNLCFDVRDIFHESFSPVTRIADYWCIDTLSVCSSCKLRRVFTVKKVLFDTTGDDYGIEGETIDADDVPRSVEYPAAVEKMNQVISMARLRSWAAIMHRQSDPLGSSAPPNASSHADLTPPKELKGGMHIAFGRRYPAPPSASPQSRMHSHHNISSTMPASHGPHTAAPSQRSRMLAGMDDVDGMGTPNRSEGSPLAKVPHSAPHRNRNWGAGGGIGAGGAGGADKTTGAGRRFEGGGMYEAGDGASPPRMAKHPTTSQSAHAKMRSGRSRFGQVPGAAGAAGAAAAPAAQNNHYGMSLTGVSPMKGGATSPSLMSSPEHSPTWSKSPKRGQARNVSPLSLRGEGAAGGIDEGARDPMRKLAFAESKLPSVQYKESPRHEGGAAGREGAEEDEDGAKASFGLSRKLHTQRKEALRRSGMSTGRLSGEREVKMSSAMHDGDEDAGVAAPLHNGLEIEVRFDHFICTMQGHSRYFPDAACVRFRWQSRV